MSSTFTRTNISLNTEPKLIEKLRRLGEIESDEHGEFVWAMVNQERFKVYVGQEIAVPVQFAEALQAGYPVPLDEACRQCWDKELKESTGYTVAGICHRCKGTKFIDLNRTVYKFLAKGMSEIASFDPTKMPPPKKSAKVKEAVGA